MPIRVPMPNGTVRPFREGTPKSVIRRAIADMLAEMKASGDYDDCDFSAFEPKAKGPRKVDVTQFGPTRILRPNEIESSPGATTLWPTLQGDAAPVNTVIPQPKPQAPAPQVAPTASPQPKSAYTRERLAAILYNEAAGFRGNENDLQSAFNDMAHVILNRENAGVVEGFGKGGGLASDTLSNAQKNSIATYPPATRAWERALAAADSALANPGGDRTNGATHFWHPDATHPKVTPQPDWATGIPATVNGQFTNVQTGDDTWLVNTYHDPRLERRRP